MDKTQIFRCLSMFFFVNDSNWGKHIFYPSFGLMEQKELPIKEVDSGKKIWNNVSNVFNASFWSQRYELP